MAGVTPSTSSTVVLDAQRPALVVHLLVARFDEFDGAALQFLRGFLVEGFDLGQFVRAST